MISLISRFGTRFSSVPSVFSVVKGFRLFSFAALLAALGACTVGPDYVKPVADKPAQFKEADGWKTAQPSDQLLRGKWWEAFNDAQLNAMMDQVSVSNQSLAQAAAQFRQARALVQAARAGYWPTVSADASATRSKSPAGFSNQSSNGNFVQSSRAPVTNYSLSLDAMWEIDVWGRVRRTVESDVASAQASAGDLEAMKLSIQAELAQDYFQLRALDTQKQLFDDTIAAYQRSLTLTQNQYAAGVAAKVDVIQAQTQLKTTQAQALDVGVQRAQLEHAIALLLGRPPSEFSLPAATLAALPPDIPFGLPSTLLERRPDIAAAERRVAAANAQIGVAQAAYYPSLSLSASGGFQSSSFSNWLTAPSRFWSIGPDIAQTLFDAGLRRAQTAQAVAAYDATVAAYRQTVLTGFKEVEDNLVALRILEQEAAVQDEAVQNARQSVTLTTNQYKAGLVSYLNVVTVQATALANERSAVDIQNRRLAASVLLIKALGGGWDAATLPQSDELARGDAYPRKDTASQH
ncbi:MAG TPA: efflux transporter outer membrane subunit [Burkholderiales bacterium]|nr:efflux transporter outer membrane subunit [Burkholderiales bacterium]